jgi:NADH:ubiquinone oxidoreductase subunit 6 (subunit J)
MPEAGSISETALVVIAIAVAIQSVVMLAAIIGAVVLARRRAAGS